MTKTTNNRRQFIRNLSLTTLSFGILGKSSFANQHAVKDTLACDVTTTDYYGVGPFYSENPPTIDDGLLAKSSETGTRIIISGRVTNLDCSEMIADAIVDVWHANDAGEYDNSGFNLRGKFKTNAQGFYQFETIRPGKYLNGSQYRPSHIHFKITPPGKPTLVTQLYFKGDTDIDKDAAASIKTGTFDATHRIIELVENTEGKLEGTWDIAIDGDGTSSVANDLHVDKGVIYNIAPNPFRDKLVVKYGVFKPAKVGLLVFDLQGKLVANLEDADLSAQKYEAVWEPNVDLPSGTYFIALKINDLQIQYLKVLRQ